ncbi:MAG: aldolase/citrate lyase family protein [Gemmatimonadetes bacterium]|nr:aldolase/citrate lyase family protein [Gemmatimonadota bacterium]
MSRFRTRALPAAFIVFAAAACAVPDASGDPAAESADSGAEPVGGPSTLAQLLSDGHAIFGTFPGPTTREQGALMGQNRELDFVFYSLESGPFDIMSTKVYMEGIAEGSGEEAAHPLILRIPPIRNGVTEAEAHAAEALAAGVGGIVFPHAESAEDAAVAVSVMGGDLWPGNSAGTLLSILIVEDAEAVDRLDEIVATPGVSVVFAGPGDLRRAYQGDMEAVEAAIQQVLAACQRHGVPCGITAGVDDIAGRIEQGFRVFIVSDPAAVTVGRGAAGRG